MNFGFFVQQLAEFFRNALSAPSLRPCPKKLKGDI
jgi:hypothetical protein